jgi:hypothetical protein
VQEAQAIMSTADELAKLEALRKSGVLVQEEFDALRTQLLAEEDEGRKGPRA